MEVAIAFMSIPPASFPGGCEEQCLLRVVHLCAPVSGV